MIKADLIAILPYITIAATSVVVMLGIAVKRSHKGAALLTLAGLALALMSLALLWNTAPRAITRLINIDQYALFFTGLILFASFVVTLLSYSYLDIRDGNHEEFYVLLLIATLGACTLAASTHFASLFLGLETLTVSLYALIAYLRSSDKSLEAGVKYLILAAVSSAFLLFGMALIYAGTGSMEFSRIASHVEAIHSLLFSAGLGLMLVGIGFKLAVVPFHLWTPDVYEGAPAPITAFVATVSKGAVFAVLLRFFSSNDVHANKAVFLMFTTIAIASMFIGNLLALRQDNVKRILAYSSIAHLGYLLVSFLASGPLARAASLFYLFAYFITTLGAFGVVSALSKDNRDADSLEDLHGLAWRRPWISGILIAMLLSLAGIPLFAGFVGKFYLVAAGIGSSLWLLVSVLVINSAISLYYYLRIIAAVFAEPGEFIVPAPSISPISSAVLTALTALLIWLGVYPGPVIELINTAINGL